MIDIHCHILPGVDDGAKDMAQAIEMAKIAVSDGISHIIATPHFNNVFRVPRSVVVNKVAELQKRLAQAGVKLGISAGNEVTLWDEADFYKRMEKNEFCYLNEKKSFLLLEQPWAGYFPRSKEVTEDLVNHGIIPIIPHPERHFFFRENPGLLLDLLARGAWTQVSADSLVGHFDEDARQFGKWLVQENYAHTLATDAHNTQRKPNLSSGFAVVRELAGADREQEILSRMRQIIDADSSSSKNPVTA